MLKSLNLGSELKEILGVFVEGNTNLRGTRFDKGLHLRADPRDKHIFGGLVLAATILVGHLQA